MRTELKKPSAAWRFRASVALPRPWACAEGGRADWLPDMDLNHDKQIQSLLCYRYTIGHGNIVKLRHPAKESRNCGLRIADCGFPSKMDSAPQSVSVAHFREDFATDGADGTDFLEQKETKKTKDECLFASFVSLCGDFFPDGRDDEELSIREIRGSIPSVAADRVALMQSAIRNPQSAIRN